LNCTRSAPGVRESANTDFPIGEEGEITEELAVGKELPREWKESLTLRAELLKVLVGAAAAESGCVRVVSEL
jgi:hypothetical protein